MPTGPTAKGEVVRKRILDAAIEIIHEWGVATFTLDELCARSSTSRGQIFHYFPEGKSQILTAVAAEERARVVSQPSLRIPDLGSWSAWHQWRDQLVGAYDHNGAGCDLGVLTSQLAIASPGARDIVAELMRQWHDHIAAGIEKMKIQNVIRPEIDSLQTSRALIAGIQGGAMMSLMTGSSSHLAAAVDVVIEYLRQFAK
ncbi:TetR family transcriptional regulator C-terminal domain-containing protein [Mycobacteroides abscessus]|uniref:TetR family transcriptional regulator C-terminal domain-containing protein n=1 Tax=Mycobacteroides abscessus TaxID=36809 RepID=UPI0018968712